MRNKNEHLAQYLRENPDLFLVSALTDEEQEIVLWANDQKYIALQKAPTGELCVDSHSFEAAFMWREKIK